MNIYVGNLSYKTTEEDLKKAFEAYGQVDAVRIITDKMSGRSKGFGFVEMPDSTAANTAIQSMNGKEFGGRQLKVNESQPRPDGGGSRGGGRGGYGGGGGRGGYDRGY